jgi:hypothetical protein
MTQALIALLLALGVAAPAWADHGVGLRSPGMSPIVAALVWGSAALLVGVAIVALVTVFVRRRPAPPQDG